jgi:phage N-6-adenine-methyltransferase
MNHDDAEEYTQALGLVVAGGWRQVALGKRLGVPRALGLSTQDWVENRLGGYVRLSITDRREAVRELSEDGMSNRQIAEVIGVSPKTVDRESTASNDAPLAADTDVNGPTTASNDAPPPASEPDATLDEGHIPLPDDEPEPPTGRRLEAIYSSASDDWSTPPEFFDLLDAEFHFDLDVCASDTNAKCKDYYTAADDGLAHRWAGTCWMNPPYGEDIGKWMAKAHLEAERGATVVCLVPARTDTGWWWNHARHGEVRFVRGRLRFGGAGAAPFPNAVVVLGRPAGVVWWEAWPV